MAEVRARTRGQQFTAMRRLLAIAPILECARQSARRKKLPLGGEQGHGISLTETARRCAKANGVSIATIWLWYRKVRKEGFNALAHERSDIGASRFFALHPENAPRIQELALRNPRLAVREIARELQSSPGSSIPNYQTLRRFVNRIRARRGQE